MTRCIQKFNYREVLTALRSFASINRVITATIVIILLVAVFFVGAHKGYRVGYTDGENSANGWWIDKKSRYYESSEIKKKRINLKYNQI